MQLLIDLLAFLTPYGAYCYVVMLGILIACGFGLPMPEDIVLVTSGILASHGIAHFPLVVVVCMVGVIAGDAIVFTIGRTFGPAIKSKGPFRKILSEKTDRRVLKVMQKYGDKVVFMARFMPGLRTPIFLTCGAYQVRPWKFILLDGLAALISVPLWIYVGYVFGQNLEVLELKIRQFQFGLYFVVAAVVVIFITFTVIKKKSLKNILVE